MTRHSKLNESVVRSVRKKGTTRITTIPKSVVDSLHIENGDALEWEIVEGKMIVAVRKVRGFKQ